MKFVFLFTEADSLKGRQKGTNGFNGSNGAFPDVVIWIRRSLNDALALPVTHKAMCALLDPGKNDWKKAQLYPLVEFYFPGKAESEMRDYIRNHFPGAQVV
jgi:hypothetical protein